MKRARQTQHYATHFYPLDAILNWNRLYGARGMLQYQCVIPWGEERSALPALLAEIARSGQASFLAVLKTFGDRPSPGLLSFPRPGTTLALDFPNRGEATHALMARLDAIVREANGALYPAKRRTDAGGHVSAIVSALGGLRSAEGSGVELRFLAESFPVSDAPRRIAILGAASAIAEAAARLWAAGGARLRPGRARTRSPSRDRRRSAGAGRSGGRADRRGLRRGERGRGARAHRRTAGRPGHCSASPMACSAIRRGSSAMRTRRRP